MSKIVFFDTSFLSHYLVPNPNDASRVLKGNIVVNLIDQLKEQKCELYLSTVVVTELLAAFNDDIEAREKALKAILEIFQLASFDLRSSITTINTLASNGYFKNKSTIKSGERIIIKEDYKILGTALQYGAAELYTDDKAHFNKYSGGEIKIISTDEVVFQPKLFSSNP